MLNRLTGNTYNSSVITYRHVLVGAIILAGTKHTLVVLSNFGLCFSIGNFMIKAGNSKVKQIFLNFVATRATLFYFDNSVLIFETWNSNELNILPCVRLTVSFCSR